MDSISSKDELAPDESIGPDEPITLQSTKCGTVTTGWSIVSLIQGPALMGIPFAVAQCGWSGVPAIIMVALIGAFTANLLKECMHERCPADDVPADCEDTDTPLRPSERQLLRPSDGYLPPDVLNTDIRTDIICSVCVRGSFSEIAEDSFGRPGRIATETIMVLELIGANISLIILLGVTTRDMVKSIVTLSAGSLAESSAGRMSVGSAAVAGCLLLVVVLVLVREMRWIMLMSAASGVLCQLTVAVLLAHSVSQHQHWRVDHIRFIDESFPTGFGVIVFSYCGHTYFPTVIQNMRQPQRFSVAANIAFIFSALVKSCLGVGMLLVWDGTTSQVATENLKNIPSLHLIASLLEFGNAFLVLPLVVRVLTDIWDAKLLPYLPSFREQTGRHWIWLVSTRLFIVAILLLLGALVPFFGLILAFVGSITGNCLIFIGPCLFYMKLRSRTLRAPFACALIAVIAFGLVSCVVGACTSGMALKEAFQKRGGVI